ncbi:imidazoleglycerol-phosphate dehydratase HisB [Syntrophothermus lipocalidus]|uniref:Imidazoleglycerol-phosphate dehydratase n=1 Tax=Syntrophothermus lipocalidus (strain DSM 12680 / TGB-C1) TaxID=643648 RepID=D7CL12_SYNLT|nr:imidazoleglycerol-phosphate dehydratase HisB [Syntrophothermus lipocalidus]ADI01397.1 Imidazoleglycerol-phosphate dehydratase [Syntrophothermus lipocalidus DSM 12680]
MSDEIRSAEIHRKTTETEILLRMELDGTGSYQIDTEMPFLGHMLALFSMHSLCNLKVWARGDTEVDDHHTVEDIGLCFGLALKQAIGDKKGLRRYGSATIPMDEALARVVVDLSGRPYLSYHVPVPGERVGTFATELVEEFFRAVVNSAGITLHIDLIRGSNSHHILEAVFKAFARALKEAIEYEPRVEGVWSTKGKL